MSDALQPQPAQPASARTDLVEALATALRRLQHTDRGTVARLRRVHPWHQPNESVFETERLLQAAGIQAQGEARRRWTLMLHCLALARGQHADRDDAEPGCVLTRMRVKEARVRQLVDADLPTLVDLLPRLARRIGSAGETMNWWPLLRLLSADENDRVESRHRIVRHYLRSTSMLTIAPPIAED